MLNSRMRNNWREIVLAAYWIALLTATHWPRLPGLDIPGKDKTEHLIAYGILTALILIAATRRLTRYPRLVITMGAVVIIAIFAAFDERTQPYFNRCCDLYDWYADVGSAAAVSAIYLLIATFSRTKAKPPAAIVPTDHKQNCPSSAPHRPYGLNPQRRRIGRANAASATQTKHGFANGSSLTGQYHPLTMLQGLRPAFVRQRPTVFSVPRVCCSKQEMPPRAHKSDSQACPVDLAHHSPRHQLLRLRQTNLQPSRRAQERKILITAETRYRLFVNGQPVCRGPARGYPEHQPYDEVDVAPYLHKGANVLAALIHYWGCDSFQNINANAAGLLVAGRIACRNGKTVEVSTSRDWRMLPAACYDTRAARSAPRCPSRKTLTPGPSRTDGRTLLSTTRVGKPPQCASPSACLPGMTWNRPASRFNVKNRASSPAQ